MTEKQLQDAIVDAATKVGWLAYHTFDSRRSAAGFPDLVLVKAPRLIFAELKTADGALTDDQVVWSAALLMVSQVVRSLVDDAVWADRAPLVSWHLWRPADWSSGAIEAQLVARVTR